MTGFLSTDPLMAGKRLELLKNIAPEVRRVSVMFNAVTAGAYIDAEWHAAETSAALLGIEITAAPIHDAADVEGVIAPLGQPGHGLLVAPDITTIINRQLIAELAARHRVPAFYPYRFFTTAGGLASYGPDIGEHYRLAVGYIDRILKGTKPDDLPVQAPTKLEFAINSRAAAALPLAIPPALLALADEVIE
jgi:putative ABC transport system substrate-binding protein